MNPRQRLGRECTQRAYCVAMLALGLAGCNSREGCIDVGKRMELMEHPDYTSTRVVDSIGPGRHEYTDLSCDKNYGWYEVVGEHGTVGYLIAGIAVVPANCSDAYRDPASRPRSSTIPWADSPQSAKAH